MLRVKCSGTRQGWLQVRPLTGSDALVGLPRWVAGVLPLCQNLTALHLARVELKELPALPLLVHLILEECEFQPALVASIRGLAALETLHVSGGWEFGNHPGWDVHGCTRLRRLHMGIGLASSLAEDGEDLRVPSACSVATALSSYREEWEMWLVQLGRRLTSLRWECISVREVALCISVMHAPQLSQLRHISLILNGGLQGSLCVACLLGALPRCVEGLHLDYPSLLSEEAVVAVPASLRALRIKGVCREYFCGRGCCCAPSQRAQDLAFGLHAGLERLCLVLWGARVSLRCLDAGAPAGLRALNVQARGVDMDARLAAEVAHRGRVLDCCDVIDNAWDTTHSVVPPVQVAYIGQGLVHMEYRCDVGRVRHWACTCGTCAECLGPEALGGLVDYQCYD